MASEHLLRDKKGLVCCQARPSRSLPHLQSPKTPRVPSHTSFSPVFIMLVLLRFSFTFMNSGAFSAPSSCFSCSLSSWNKGRIIIMAVVTLIWIPPSLSAQAFWGMISLSVGHTQPVLGSMLSVYIYVPLPASCASWGAPVLVGISSSWPPLLPSSAWSAAPSSSVPVHAGARACSPLPRPWCRRDTGRGRGSAMQRWSQRRSPPQGPKPGELNWVLKCSDRTKTPTESSPQGPWMGTSAATLENKCASLNTECTDKHECYFHIRHQKTVVLKHAKLVN